MPDEPERFLRKKEVIRRIGVTDFTLWRWVRQGLFPQSFRLNPQAGGSGGPVAWKESEVQAWMDARPAGHSPGFETAWVGTMRKAATGKGKPFPSQQPMIRLRRGDDPSVIREKEEAKRQAEAEQTPGPTKKAAE